eukprot:1460358-Pyramimonas_sp.AAC.1
MNPPRRLLNSSCWVLSPPAARQSPIWGGQSPAPPVTVFPAEVALTALSAAASQGTLSPSQGTLSPSQGTLALSGAAGGTRGGAFSAAGFVLPHLLRASSSPVGEEGDPGRGGLQGTRPRAGQLGGPASHGLLGGALHGSAPPGPPVLPALDQLQLR